MSKTTKFSPYVTLWHPEESFSSIGTNLRRFRPAEVMWSISGPGDATTTLNFIEDLAKAQALCVKLNAEWDDAGWVRCDK